MVTRRLAALLAVAATLAALAGCGSATVTRLAYANASFAYNNLGSDATWTLDDYFHLTTAQEDWVRERMDKALARHRAQELPRYRRFFEEVLAKAEAPFSAEEVGARYADVRSSYHRAVEQLVPDFAELLAAVDATQVTHLERKFAEENRKFVRESIRGTPEERRERREQRFANHIEAWVGPLSDAQRALVDAHYRNLPDLSEEMLGERRFRQTEILALARAKPPKAEMQAQLRHLLVETDSWRRPEYLAAVRERDARAFAMVAELSATLSDKQRSALQSRIRGFLRDIASLSAAG
jgi:hypothetical protein